MGRYRKKPIVIEAMRVRLRNVEEVARWSHGVARDKAAIGAGLSAIVIDTLEGQMHADLGDWIIRGVKGEFYPCKPDVFEATYEPAGETACELNGHVLENNSNWCMVCNRDVGMIEDGAG